MECVICCWSGDFNNYGGRVQCQCPKCLSLERHRSAWYVVSDLLKKSNSGPLKILHVAPTKCLHDALSVLGDDYYPIDINPNNKYIRYVSDITRLPFPDCSFDVVICLHTLDEVSDDFKAVSEMMRVVKSEGSIVVTSYVNDCQANTIEVDMHLSEEIRRKKYGSSSRRRIYGKDFVSRLSIHGLSVFTIPNASEEFAGRSDANEVVYLCIKW